MNVTNLKIDSLDLRSGDFIFYPQNLFNLDNEIIDNDTYGDGKVLDHVKTNPRKFILNGFIKDNVQSNLSLLASVFDNNQVHKLSIGISSMPDRYINVTKLNETVSEPWNDEISYQLVADDPYMYSSDTQNIFLGSTSKNGLAFPLAFPVVFGAISGGQGILSNKGNVATYPVITVVGSCSNITITNTTTGDSMSLKASLGATDILIIDNNPKTRSIKINGINRMDLKDGSWLSVVPGDNAFAFSRTSIEAKQHCSISLQSRWI